MGIQLFNDGVHQIDIKFQIVSGDKDKVFKAEERVVGDFAFLTIRTRTNNIVLNREKGDSYRLRIKATVSRSRAGTKKRIVDEAETIVDVKVLDKNDLSPLFYPIKYTETITDDTPLHQSILRVTAEDADIGINGGEFNFLILSRTLLTCLSCFIYPCTYALCWDFCINYVTMDLFSLQLVNILTCLLLESQGDLSSSADLKEKRI